MAADQTLITPPSCQTSTTPDHQPGTEATQVRVTVSETCTGATYNTERFQRLIKEQINQQAREQRGKGYALTGAIQSRIMKATTQAHGTMLLQVSNTASYAYQFTGVQQQTIKSMIAGKAKPRQPASCYKSQACKAFPSHSATANNYRLTQTRFTLPS